MSVCGNVRKVFRAGLRAGKVEEEPGGKCARPPKTIEAESGFGSLGFCNDSAIIWSNARERYFMALVIKTICVAVIHSITSVDVNISSIIFSLCVL